jgi:hypothetical protein
MTTSGTPNIAAMIAAMISSGAPIFGNPPPPDNVGVGDHDTLGLCPVGRLLNASMRPVTPQLVNRVVAEGMTESTADAWLAAWAEQAARDGMERGAAYWDAGWAWIAEQRLRRVRP